MRLPHFTSFSINSLSANDKHELYKYQELWPLFGLVQPNRKEAISKCLNSQSHKGLVIRQYLAACGIVS